MFSIKCAEVDLTYCMSRYNAVGPELNPWFNSGAYEYGFNLSSSLCKVLIYLRSPNWDTRIAAGQAVEAIVKNIPEWNPAPKPKEGNKYSLMYFSVG